MAKAQQTDADEKNQEPDARQGPNPPAQEGSGDIILAELGENVHKAAIGKNIRQTFIDNLHVVVNQVPFLTPQLLALVVLPLLAVSLLIWILLRPLRSGGQPVPTTGISRTPVCHQVDVVDPAHMTGEFNVAVAQFGEADAQGKVLASEDGQHLSRWLYDRLLDEYQGACPDLAVQIWHDAMDAGLKQVEIGTMLGDSPNARAEAASELASRIGANLVIYGHLDRQVQPATFTPEFYVSDLAEAEDILGRHQLGAPIPVQLPIDRLGTRLQLNSRLVGRIRVLSLFTVGLAWESAREPEQALATFQQVEESGAWPETDGKEILYLFIGREAHLAEQEDEAQSAFQRALDLNPAYARAHLGLGNIDYDRAQQLLYQSKLRQPLLQKLELAVERPRLNRALDQALAEYQAALGANLEAPDANVEVKAHMALGGLYRLQGDADRYYGDEVGAGSLFDQSIREFEQALALAGDDDAHRLRGQIYLGLGMARHIKSYVEPDAAGREALLNQALEAYQACIQQAQAAPSDWWLEYFKTDFCVPYQTMAEETLRSMHEGGNP